MEVIGQWYLDFNLLALHLLFVHLILLAEIEMEVRLVEVAGDYTFGNQGLLWRLLLHLLPI